LSTPESTELNIVRLTSTITSCANASKLKSQRTMLSKTCPDGLTIYVLFDPKCVPGPRTEVPLINLRTIAVKRPTKKPCKFRSVKHGQTSAHSPRQMTPLGRWGLSLANLTLSHCYWEWSSMESQSLSLLISLTAVLIIFSLLKLLPVNRTSTV
jgi:hypothetical protein